MFDPYGENSCTVSERGGSVRRLRVGRHLGGGAGIAPPTCPPSESGARDLPRQGTRGHAAADGACRRAWSGGHHNVMAALRSSSVVETLGRRMAGGRKRATTMTAPRPRPPQQPKQLDSGILQAEGRARSLCTWPPRARPPEGSASAPRRWLVRRRPPARPGQLGQVEQRISGGGSGRRSPATAARTPATSTARCSRSSNGWPPKTNCPTRCKAAAAARHRQAGPGLHRRGADPARTGVRGPQVRQRRDTAIIAVLTATGIRLSELAALRYDPGDPRRSDVDLWQREITVRGKGGKPRIVSRPPGRPEPGPVPARPLPARAGLAAAAVAGPRQPGAADRRRHLPDDHPPRPPVRRGRRARTGSGTTSATPGWTAAAPRAT